MQQVYCVRVTPVFQAIEFIKIDSDIIQLL